MGRSDTVRADGKYMRNRGCSVFLAHEFERITVNEDEEYLKTNSTYLQLEYMEGTILLII